jgi:ABC-type sugar transport system substrate-binding protein
MNRRFLLLTAVAGLFGLALAQAPMAGSALAQAKTFKVGVSLPEAQNPFYIVMGNSISKTLKDAGLEVTLLLSNSSDVNEQVSQINDLIAAKVDAILVSPQNTEGPAPAIQKAHDAGIPIFMIARTLDPKYKDLWKTYVGFDYYKVGVQKGKWVVDNLKPGKIAMLLGPAGALVSVNMAKGFKETVEKAGFTVVWEQNQVQTRENGLKFAEDALVANKDIVAIYAMNDDLALGAAQAVKAGGQKVATLGMNGAPTALAAVHNGDLSMTILLDPVGWGKQAALMVADYLTKKQEPSAFVEPFTPEVVTQANAYDKIPVPLREKLGVKPRS